MSSRSIGSLVRKVGGTLGAGAPEVSDAQLLERVRSRPADGAAFEAIVRRHGPMVLGVCRRVLRGHAESDDAFQATFLVFLRRAASLHRPECLAGWLFQVAYRTARKSLARVARLRRRELPLVDVPSPEPVAELVWRDLWPVLDEELDRLPERYRLPIVLCFLEGRTKRQGAGTLGWPEGTFASRLQRGRELLRKRLTRRGLALSAGVFSVALFQGSADAAVPASLLTSTIQTASAWAAPVTGPAVVLAKGVIQSMFLTKMKAAALTLVAVTALGGGGSWAVHSWTGGSVLAADGPGQAGADGANKPSAPKQTATADSTLEKIPYVNRLFRKQADGSVAAADPAAPKPDTTDSVNRDLEKINRDLEAQIAEAQRAAHLADAEARVKADLLRKLEAEMDLLRQGRANRDRPVGQKVDNNKLNRFGQSQPGGTTRPDPLALKHQIAALRKQLEESESRLAELEVQQAQTVPGKPVKPASVEYEPPQISGKRLHAVPGKATETSSDGDLNEQIRMAEERLQWSRRMAQKGYLSTTQLQTEMEELDRLKARLEARQGKHAARQGEADDLVREKAAAYDQIAELVKRGAASRGELGQARAALAEARIRQANDTIRREAETLLELTKEDLIRANRLHESGAISKPELEKARKALQDAEKRFMNAK